MRFLICDWRELRAGSFAMRWLRQVFLLRICADLRGMLRAVSCAMRVLLLVFFFFLTG